jgi:hypothetical protein
MRPKSENPIFGRKVIEGTTYFAYEHVFTTNIMDNSKYTTISYSNTLQTP